MSANPELEGIVALPGQVAPVEPVEAQIPESSALQLEVKAKRERPRWVASVAVGAVAVLASGALGSMAYSAAEQRNAARDQAVATQAKLAAAQTDAARKKAVADYVSAYVAESGRVQRDYQTFVACDSFSSCRTSSQNLLISLQAFQAAPMAPNAPDQIASSNSELGDALSAAIAATQQVITAFDTDDVDSLRAGLHKLNAAMLSLAKAQVSLGSQLE